MRQKFWKWLLLLSYNQIKDNLETVKYEIPGIRDTDNPCKSYTPGTKKWDRGFNHCEGDGHYLCVKCRYYKKENEDENE
jgi:hypothetical protein